MNNQLVITVFNNVHSQPNEAVVVDNLAQSLISMDDIHPVDEVTQTLKEHNTQAYTLCTFKDLDSAAHSNMDLIYGVVLDIDDGHASFELIRGVLSELDIECLIHTTAKHTQAIPRMRVVIPYLEPLVGVDAVAHHRAVWDHFNDLLGPLDPAGKNPAQKWLYPKYILDGESFLHEVPPGNHRFNPHTVKIPDKIVPEQPEQTQISTWSPQKDELSLYLEKIDPSCTRAEWVEAIAAALNTYGRSVEVIDTLDEWSQQAPDKYDQETFYRVVESIRDDHPNKAGIGKLRYLAGINPTADPEKKQDIRITADDLALLVEDEYQSKALELTHNTFERTCNLLTKYDNQVNTTHARAIWAITEGLAYAAYSSKPIRVAYPLPTGMGKTTTFRSFVSSIYHKDLETSVAYCAERIEDLASLKNSMIEDGIPETDIGLLHSSGHIHKEIPSIDITEAEEYQFLLLAHGRVQHRFTNPDRYLYFQGRKRDLIVWDEALVTTQGNYLDIDQVRGDIAKWKDIYQTRKAEGRVRKGFEEQYDYMDSYLETVKVRLDPEQYESEIDMPDFSDDRMIYLRCLKTILGKSGSTNLERLVEQAGSSGKLIRAHSNKAYINFEVVVPDEVKKIVVLDASAEVNQLMQYDKSVKLGDIGHIQKDYENVTLYHAPVKSSRDYLSQEFRQTAESNLYLKELGHIVPKLIPTGEDFLVFTYKDRNDVNYKTQILEYLDTLGLGFRERCHVITWGNERGSNLYSHVKYAVTLGVIYRDPSEIAASIVGQSRDLAYSVDNKEIKRVSDSLQADILYQGLSRGNMRHVINGKAGNMICWVLHKEEHAMNLLLSVMPNAKKMVYTPKHLALHGISDAVLDIAERIIAYLNSLPDSEGKCSIKSITKFLGITQTNSRTWRDAIKRVEKLQYEWTRPSNGQSFLRRKPLSNQAH
ncbi:hypothetical protein A3193_03685 [Candidatus Thiodiazotropha endoloripes]|uniref:PriCT-2 domain-containing protein n=1 Tax=Candidatus Thiodiazotropha endoloripes TaxID=1818881 RepID=UPI00083CEC9A|nr:PriCT-2 domain-containing protein [Candidatus Thiodiazotropha endoloripes]ODB88005.1 hypothetical protein A3193_03685 [Candidatus Thiodiazotropha endoloripes]